MQRIIKHVTFSLIYLLPLVNCEKIHSTQVENNERAFTLNGMSFNSESRLRALLTRHIIQNAHANVVCVTFSLGKLHQLFTSFRLFFLETNNNQI